MKRILLKIALFFGLLLAPFATLFLAPYAEEFAYHYIEQDCYNHGAWIYDRISHNPARIDIAFIGSSHTIHAIQEKNLEEICGAGIHVANLGYCRYGRNLEYVFLRLLLNHKSPKVIVIEVHEDEEKYSHDIFPYLAETKDLLLTPTPVNRDYFSDIFHGASARLEYIRARYIFRSEIPEPSEERYGYGYSERIATKEELQENETAWQRRLQKSEFQSIEKIKLKYPLKYLEKMTGLIREKNILLLFMYLPEYGSKLKSPKYAGYYQNAATLLIPPSFIFDDETNWMDASHLNDKGSGLLSEWMAEQLKHEFCSGQFMP